MDIFLTIVLVVSSIVFLLGLLIILGSDTTEISKLPSPFDFIFYSVVFVLLPVYLIQLSLSGISYINIQIPLWIVFVIGIVVFCIMAFQKYTNIYNYFIGIRESVDKHYILVETEYKKRFDLIPNIIKAINLYNDKETGMIDKVLQTKSNFFNATSNNEKINAMNQLNDELSIFVKNVREYPDLKSADMIHQLIATLMNTEDDIEYQVNKYNEKVQTFNTGIKSFPYHLILSKESFKIREYINANLGKEIQNSASLLDGLK